MNDTNTRVLQAMNLFKIIDIDVIDEQPVILAKLSDSKLKLALSIIISSFMETRTIFRNLDVYLKTYSSPKEDLIDLAPLATVIGAQFQNDNWEIIE